MAQREFDRAARMLVDVAVSRDARGMTIQVSSFPGRPRPSRNGDVSSSTLASPVLANIAREHIGQPQMRIARLGALAEACAAVRGAMPPFEHVAFEELLAGVQHDLRARQARLEKDQRQHVLQLVAIAGRAAALVRADAPPQPRGIELIGQPGVDQAIEVGPVGARPRPCRAAVAQAARVAASSASASTTSARRATGQRFRAVGAWPKTMAIFCSSPGRESRFAGRRPPRGARRHAPRRRAARLDHRRRMNVAARAAEEARADRFGRRAGRLVAAKAKPRSKSLRGFSKQQRRADRLGRRSCRRSRWGSRRARCRRTATTRRRVVARADIAQRQIAACRTGDPGGTKTTYSSVRSPRVFAKVATPGS